MTSKESHNEFHASLFFHTSVSTCQKLILSIDVNIKDAIFSVILSDLYGKLSRISLLFVSYTLENTL